MEEEKWIEWYKNFCRFSEKYFPNERMGVGDKLILKKLTQDSYDWMISHEIKPNGTDLLRRTSEQMNLYGYKPRRVN